MGIVSYELELVYVAAGGGILPGHKESSEVLGLAVVPSEGVAISSTKNAPQTTIGGVGGSKPGGSKCCQLKHMSLMLL